MNEQEREELERLKRRQWRLEQELKLLGTHLSELELRLHENPPATQRATPSEAPRTHVGPPPIPKPATHASASPSVGSHLRHGWCKAGGRQLECAASALGTNIA